MLTGCREYRKLLIEMARGTVAGHERRGSMLAEPRSRVGPEHAAACGALQRGLV